jgi:hypothetical protein
MSVADDITSAVSFTELPCYNGVYEGQESTFLTINMDAIPDNFADDAPQYDRWLVQLHLFAPYTLDTTTLRRQIRDALHNAGFTYPSLVDASADKALIDGTEQHIVFEFEVPEAIVDV